MRDTIYCSGSLLDAVQKAKLFVDCKHFVDMPLKFDAETVITNWNIVWAASSQEGAISREVLQAFVDEHFDQPGNELEECFPEDWNQDHSFDTITDPSYRKWAAELHKLWPSLSRKVRDEVHASPERFSLLPLPKPFIVPGGRFRELYYWDSFFSIQGLIKSGMMSTVRGMIENMCYLIRVYGHIYNGNRVYYKNRSQPPLLTWCVKSYLDATNDLEFLRECMPSLEAEMAYFMKNKRIQQEGWKSYLFRFYVVADGPRPESYREDIETAEHLSENDQKLRLWGDICAAAESGRDFSCRWFSTEGDHAGKISSMRTSEIAPVELNAVIARNLRLFSEFYGLLGDSQQAERYRLEYEIMREAIHQVFWNEDKGIWLDFDLIKNKHIDAFHDTHLFPLFAEIAHDGFSAKRVVEYLELSGALSQPGGLPTSMILNTSQQWDAPNGWSPTNWIAIKGLIAYGQTAVAKEIAYKWINRNFAIYRSSGGKMFEKYNVMSDCLRALGGSGEYECQEGFGWTNAVILDLLHTFGSELVFQETTESKCECCRRPATEEVYVPPVAPMPLNIPEIVVEQIAANICTEVPVPQPAVQDAGVLLVPAV
ncbi:Trehalase [Aphelenchoides besseyi]|uniref:Trehalase n=1 Tax=Aphelenchoides besseyi TaxID=269767 RepID=A0A1W6ALG9_9BILA|nr:putative trehalase [Aphelenchoides besseyi]KAI6187160.1 Trehalase [Aphelenchoides besseyi]KAI6200403.1 Trehalase [Aphelenchoides besseyi]